MRLGVFAKHISRATPEELFDTVAGFGLDCTQFNAACLGTPSLPESRSLPSLRLSIRWMKIRYGSRATSSAWSCWPKVP